MRPEERKKAETATVKGTITKVQRDIGILGSNEQDVIGKIITLWLYNEGHIKIKKRATKK